MSFPLYTPLYPLPNVLASLLNALIRCPGLACVLVLLCWKCEISYFVLQSDVIKRTTIDSANVLLVMLCGN